MLELVCRLRELADVPGQAVHAVHEQQLVDAVLRLCQRIAKAGTLERGTGCLVGEAADDPPAILRTGVGLQPLGLCAK